MERTMRKPVGYTSMTEAIRALKARGFTANFEYQKGAFHVVDSDRSFHEDELSIVEHHRFEGLSDPDDMSVLYAIEASDGTRGTIVDAFGVYADPNLGAALQRVKIKEYS